MCNDPNLDIVSISAYTKFCKILSICTQDIERKQNYDRITLVAHTTLLEISKYKNLFFTSDTFKQITLAIKAIFRQTYYKANVQQVKISCKRKTF